MNKFKKYENEEIGKFKIVKLWKNLNSKFYQI